MSSKYKAEYTVHRHYVQLIRARTSSRSGFPLPEAAVDRLAKYCRPEMTDFMTSDGLPDRTALGLFLSRLAANSTNISKRPPRPPFYAALLMATKLWWFSTLRRDQPKEFEQITQGTCTPDHFFWMLIYEREPTRIGTVTIQHDPVRAESCEWCLEIIDFLSDASYSSEDRTQALDLWAKYTNIAENRLAASSKAHEEASAAKERSEELQKQVQKHVMEVIGLVVGFALFGWAVFRMFIGI